MPNTILISGRKIRISLFINLACVATFVWIVVSFHPYEFCMQAIRKCPHNKFSVRAKSYLCHLILRRSRQEEVRVTTISSLKFLEKLLPIILSRKSILIKVVGTWYLLLASSKNEHQAQKRFNLYRFYCRIRLDAVITEWKTNLWFEAQLKKSRLEEFPQPEWLSVVTVQHKFADCQVFYVLRLRFEFLLPREHEPC